MALEGKQLGRYHVLRLLGSGGMGEVYLAEDPRIGQQVALKVIRAELTPYPNAQSAQEAARLFQREARAIGQLDHPHILPLYDYGESQLGEQTLIYLVMPYRPEGSLVSWIRQHYPDRLAPPDLVAHFIRQAAQAIQYAHDHQIIHQDVKPSNFLLRERKEDPAHPDVLLGDFGIAHLATSTASSSQNLRGTPTYMAPEQCVGKPVPASDQYALAVMAYELLAGRPPFQGNAVHLIFQHLQVPPAPPGTLNPHLPKELDAVIMTALSKGPEERFRSVTAFANAFQQAAQGFEIVDASTLIRPAPVQMNAPASQITSDMSQASTMLSVPATEITPPTAETVVPATPTLPTIPAQTTPPGSFPGFAAITDPNTLGKPTAILPDVADEARAEPVAAIEDQTPAGSIPSTPPLPAGLSATGPLPVPLVTNPPRRKIGKGRLALLAAAALLALLLVFGSIGYIASGANSSSTKKGSSNGSGSNTPVLASSATITIIPASAPVNNTFPITAVTGSPGSQQVQARQLSATTQTYQKTVNATGQGTTPATQATGTLTVSYGGNASSASVPAGSTFTDTNGVTIVTDADANPPSHSSVDVPAHAVVAGSTGNIPANDINHCILFNGACLLGVTNTTPFAGGRDASTFPVVQQSDIDVAANSLISANQPDSQQMLQGQVQSNERLVGAQCSSNVSANQKAGDQVAQVTVSVYFTCTGETYDYNGALTVAAQLLTNQAASNPGAGYVLVGQIKTNLTNAAPAGGGTVALTVSADGVWAYQISASQQQAWAQLIAGKTVQEAQQLLASQTGVAQATVQVAGGNGQTLPSDSSKIKFVVQTPPGA